MSRVSIFIWKSDEADKKEDSSWSSIRHHRGTDWFREDRGLERSQSYRLLLQGKLAVNEADDGIWFIAEQMPSHWMGREQLTSADILYQLILQEGGWVWDRLGIWNRCMRPDTGKTMEEQWKEVSLWREGESIPIVIPVSDPTPVPVLQNRHYYESTKQKHNRGRGNGRNRGGSNRESERRHNVIREHGHGQEHMRGRGRGHGKSRGGGSNRGYRDRGNTSI